MWSVRNPCGPFAIPGAMPSDPVSIVFRPMILVLVLLLGLAAGAGAVYLWARERLARAEQASGWEDRLQAATGDALRQSQTSLLELADAKLAPIKETLTKFEEQSREPDLRKRQQLVWEIDRKLQEDVARPIIMNGLAATCLQSHVKDLTIQSNSIYNGWRFEDVWLDK